MLFASSGTWDPENPVKGPFDRYVLKTATLRPRDEVEWRKPLPGGGYLNRVNLNNRGIARTLATLPELPVVVSVYAESEDDWTELARVCSAADVRWLELNFACPNVAAPAVGYSAIGTRSVLEVVREVFSGRLTAKLPPDVTDTVLSAASPADFVAFNSLRTRQGALSGAPLRPLMLDTVARAARHARPAAVIGSGGIGCAGPAGAHIEAFHVAGADHVALGTANLL